MFSRYGHVGLVGGWVIRITEMPEIIYSLGTQVPPVLGQDSFTSLLGTDLRDTVEHTQEEMEEPQPCRLDDS